MDKNYLQDVVPPAQKRSIRDIPIPARGRNNNNEIKSVPNNTNSEKEETYSPPPPPENRDFLEDDKPAPKKKKSKKIIIILSILVFLFVLFMIVSSFDSAIVKITPKTEISSFDEKILIENLSTRKSSDSLGYRVIELSQQSSKTAKAIDEEPVEESASGQITIYNEYSDQSQRLIRNTRFESSKELIYRIAESIEVPGYTEGSDGSKTPGQITVTVYADETGEKYNLESDRFTIPGFKGQEPYDFFHAETATAITGGYNGIKKIVSEEDKERVTAELQADLRSKLISELQDEITDEFYAIQNNNSFVFENIVENSMPGSDDVQLSMRGRISSKVFNKIDLSNSVAAKIFPNYYTREKTLVSNFETLAINLEPMNENNQEYLTISGNNVNFVWQIDNKQLKKDLIGTDIKSLQNIMRSYTEVKNAEATVKPFWKSKYPESEKDIKIEIMR